MENKPTSGNIVVLLVMILLQFIMAQAITLIVSLIFPTMGDYLNSQPAVFLLLLAICFFAGIFLTGWAAIRWRWLKVSPLWKSRLASTVIGVLGPLLVAYLFFRPIEAGSPFFFIAMTVGVLGFHIPTLLVRSPAAA